MYKCSKGQACSNAEGCVDKAPPVSLLPQLTCTAGWSRRRPQPTGRPAGLPGGAAGCQSLGRAVLRLGCLAAAAGRLPTSGCLASWAVCQLPGQIGCWASACRCTIPHAAARPVSPSPRRQPPDREGCQVSFGPLYCQTGCTARLAVLQPARCTALARGGGVVWRGPLAATAPAATCAPHTRLLARRLAALSWQAAVRLAPLPLPSAPPSMCPAPRPPSPTFQSAPRGEPPPPEAGRSLAVAGKLAASGAIRRPRAGLGSSPCPGGQRPSACTYLPPPRMQVVHRSMPPPCPLPSPVRLPLQLPQEQERQGGCDRPRRHRREHPRPQAACPPTMLACGAAAAGQRLTCCSRATELSSSAPWLLPSLPHPAGILYPGKRAGRRCSFSRGS